MQAKMGLKARFQKAYEWILDNHYYARVTLGFIEVALLSLLLYLLSTPNTAFSDFAMGSLVSAIFTILTIIFLTLFSARALKAREESDWDKVKKSILHRIEGIVNDLGADICFYMCELALYQRALKQNFNPENVVKQINFFEELKRITSKWGYPLDVGLLLLNEDSKKSFADYKYELDIILASNLKFFSPQLAESLFEIREEVRNMEKAIENRLTYETSKKYKVPENEEELKERLETILLTAQLSFSKISSDFPKIITELNKSIETRVI